MFKLHESEILYNFIKKIKNLQNYKGRNIMLELLFGFFLDASKQEDLQHLHFIANDFC